MSRQTQQYPAHESIVMTLKQASPSDMPILAINIKMTIFPVDHIAPIERAWKELVAASGRDEDMGVTASLRDQVKRHELAAKRPKRSPRLNDVFRIPMVTVKRQE